MQRQTGIRPRYLTAMAVVSIVFVPFVLGMIHGVVGGLLSGLGPSGLIAFMSSLYIGHYRLPLTLFVLIPAFLIFRTRVRASDRGAFLVSGISEAIYFALLPAASDLTGLGDPTLPGVEYDMFTPLLMAGGLVGGGVWGLWFRRLLFPPIRPQ